MVSCEQLPIDVAVEMITNELEVVVIFDEDASVRVASVLDVLGAVIGGLTGPKDDS
jgi:hypothetical protein